MKIFMVTYTEDKCNTKHTVIVSADNFTDAYVQVCLKISKDGAITDLFEII